MLCPFFMSNCRYLEREFFTALRILRNLGDFTSHSMEGLSARSRLLAPFV